MTKKENNLMSTICITIYGHFQTCVFDWQTIAREIKWAIFNLTDVYYIVFSHSSPLPFCFLFPAVYYLLIYSISFYFSSAVILLCGFFRINKCEPLIGYGNIGMFCFQYIDLFASYIFTIQRVLCDKYSSEKSLLHNSLHLFIYLYSFVSLSISKTDFSFFYCDMYSRNCLPVMTTSKLNDNIFLI